MQLKGSVFLITGGGSGLGAATAFSRKLKQRIALRRKRAVEGDKA